MVYEPDFYTSKFLPQTVINYYGLFCLASKQEITAAGLTLRVVIISEEMRTINILGRTGTETAS